MKNNDFYIDFEVAPWALANVCEALYKHGVTDGTITKEDGRLHIRWKYNINRDNDFWWKFNQQKPIDYPEPADSPCNPPKGSALDISNITVSPHLEEMEFNENKEQ